MGRWCLHHSTLHCTLHCKTHTVFSNAPAAPCTHPQAITCNLPQRDALLEHVVRSSTLWSRWRGQVVLLVVLLAMFYAGLYVWWWVSKEQQKTQRYLRPSTSAEEDNDPAGGEGVLWLHMTEAIISRCVRHSIHSASSCNLQAGDNCAQAAGCNSADSCMCLQG